MQLITIRFSHYCEKARWALDRFGVPYQETSFLPGFHAAAVRRVTTGKAPDRAGSRWSTPLLILQDGTCVHDSRAIVRWVSTVHGGGALYPSADVASIEDDLHDRLALHSRRLAYAHLLRSASGLYPLLAQETARARRPLLWMATPLIARTLRKAMRIDDESAAKSERIVRMEFERWSAVLSRQPHCAADGFTAADIAFACAAAPVLVVQAHEGFGAPLPALEDLPEETAALARALRETPAGQHALRMFREERGPIKRAVT